MKHDENKPNFECDFLSIRLWPWNLGKSCHRKMDTPSRQL